MKRLASIDINISSVISTAQVTVVHILLALFICLGTQTALAAPTDDFVTTWKTDNTGTSNSTSIMVPMVGGPYDVDWDNDGVFDQFGLTGPVTHDFGVAGTKTIRIKGSYDSIFFNYSDDFPKIISLDQWGTNHWVTMNNAFSGTYNMQAPATDTPDFSVVTDMCRMFSNSSANPDTSGWNTSAVTDMSGMFYGSSANPDTSGWNTSSVTDMSEMFSYASSANPNTSGWNTGSVMNMSYMFHYASSANPDTSGWNTGLVTNMAYMFYWTIAANPDTSGWNTSNVSSMRNMFTATKFSRDIGSWDVSSLQDAAGMFLYVILSIPHYESLLIGWNAQSVNSGVPFGAGQSTYCSAQAAAARANLIASDSWTFTDGGQSCQQPQPCNVNMVPGTTEYGMFSREACENIVVYPTFIAEDGAWVNFSAGKSVQFMTDFLVEKGATLEVYVCGQSLCETSNSPMPDGCHSCVTAICDESVDPYCCNNSFDSVCLDEVATVCGLVCE